MLKRLREVGRMGKIIENLPCVRASVLCTFRKASSFVTVDVEMQRLPAYFGNHAWGGEMMRNCPILKVLGHILTSLNNFRDLC